MSQRKTGLDEPKKRSPSVRYQMASILFVLGFGSVSLYLWYPIALGFFVAVLLIYFAVTVACNLWSEIIELKIRILDYRRKKLSWIKEKLAHEKECE